MDEKQLIYNNINHGKNNKNKYMNKINNQESNKIKRYVE